MEFFRKGNYSDVAKRASELLKEGIGIAEIINSTQRSLMNLNKLNNQLNKKNN